MKAQLTIGLLVLAVITLIDPGLAPGGGRTMKGGGGRTIRRGGAEITFVQQGGPADQAGLRAGDWILQIDGTDCRSAADFDRLRKGNQISVTVFRVRERSFRTFTVPVVKNRIGVSVRSGFVNIPVRR